MLGNVAHIIDRLASALGAGWDVVNGAAAQDRRPLPRADVRMQAAEVSKTSGPGVVLTATYVVRLVIQGDTGDFAQLDAALDAAVAALHNAHIPGATSRLQLQAIRHDDELEQSLIGYQLALTLITTRTGNNA